MTEGKADFSDVYMQQDPRGYYATLGALDYVIPSHGVRVFDALLDHLRSERDRPTVLDVCCSYGVNAALLNHDVTFDEIAAHYAGAEELAGEAAIDRDREWLQELRRDDALDVIGLDISAPAIEYAVASGLLVDGVVANLEENPLDPDDAAKLKDVDLVTVTGGIGYVKERTFDQIVDAADVAPWVAALTLRWVGFGDIAGTLEDHGLVTERLDGFVVPQRRFADAEEQAFVLGELEGRGIDPSGAEAEGWHCAELFVARPAAAVAEMALEDLLADVVDPTPA